MTLFEHSVAATGLVTLGLTFVGLMFRGRWRLSLFFSAYVWSVFVADFLMNVQREKFWTTEFWVLRQAVFDTLKFGLAIEMGWRTFRPFPGAASTAKRAAMGILLVTAALALSLPFPHSFAYGWATAHLARLHPPLLNGTIWLMAAVLVTARWYRVPVHPFHGGILGSLAAYMALFSALLTVMGWYGLDAIRSIFGRIDPPAYVLMTGWWVYLSWRRDEPGTIAHAELVDRLRVRAPLDAT